ncbi:MAG: tRNA (adenosine(37)-N6)-threonylcarbamoyltransferase complex dimerization subunit type 1 TsaB [Saprospiraceae bacterium]|nr:tRNA (adenosine(37)-N6)-threonylcarbamoyltransferase complex dimerization subunit type 1 TsaB [Saprospiraceae bacterium]
MSTKILNIETSTRCCSVCLSKDGLPWIVREAQCQSGHAELITLFIQEIMETAGNTLKELDAIAVSKGPGSYTGLRIGVSTAKGLCYALDKPLIAIDTLEALAYGAMEFDNAPNTVYAAMIDARRADAYVEIFDSEGVSIKDSYFCTLVPGTFDFLLEQKNIKRVVFVGDALDKYKEIVSNPHVNPGSVVLPSAKFMTFLSQKAFEKKQFEDVAYFEPFYLKSPNITKPKPKF